MAPVARRGIALALSAATGVNCAGGTASLRGAMAAHAPIVPVGVNAKPIAPAMKDFPLVGPESCGWPMAHSGSSGGGVALAIVASITCLCAVGVVDVIALPIQLPIRGKEKSILEAAAACCPLEDPVSIVAERTAARLAADFGFSRQEASGASEKTVYVRVSTSQFAYAGRIRWSGSVRLDGWEATCDVETAAVEVESFRSDCAAVHHEVEALADKCAAIVARKLREALEPPSEAQPAH